MCLFIKDVHRCGHLGELHIVESQEFCSQYRGDRERDCPSFRDVTTFTQPLKRSAYLCFDCKKADMRGDSRLSPQVLEEVRQARHEENLAAQRAIDRSIYEQQQAHQRWDEEVYAQPSETGDRTADYQASVTTFNDAFTRHDRARREEVNAEVAERRRYEEENPGQSYYQYEDENSGGGSSEHQGYHQYEDDNAGEGSSGHQSCYRDDRNSHREDRRAPRDRGRGR